MTSAGNRRMGLLSVKVIRGHCAAPSNWLVVRDPADRHVARKGKAAGRNSLEKWQNATYAGASKPIVPYTGRSIYHILWDEHPSTIILYHKIGCSPGFQGFDPFAIIFLTRWDGQLEPNDAFFVHRLQERSLSHAAKCKKRPLSIAQCQWRWTQVVDEWIGLTLPYMKNDSWLSSFCVYPRGWAFLRFDCRIETDSQQDWGPLGDGKRIPAACVQKKFGTFQFFAWWHRLREVYQWLDYAWLVMIRVIWRIKDWTSFNLPRTPAMAARIKATASSESNIVPEELAQGEQLPGLCWKFSKLVVFGCIFGNQVNK